LIKNDNSFDLRIFIGFNKKEAKLIDIAEDGKINKAKSVYFTEDEDNEVIPVQVFNYLKKHKLKLTEHSALNLLEGLYKATKNFTRKQSAEGFFIASKLMTIIQDNIQPDIGEPVKTQDET